MPSSSSSSRKNRNLRKQQRLEAPVTPYAAANAHVRTLSPPHPYHDFPPPPPSYQPLHHRTSSTESKLSDVSMDDFSSPNLESVLEYSDTSDDMREDTYFLPQENPYAPPSLLGGGNFSSHSRSSSNRYRNQTKSSSGESAFRDLRKNEGKSSRIVQFSSCESMSDSDCGDTNSDTFGGADNLDNEEGSSSHSKEPPVPVPASANASDSPDEAGHKPQVGSWMKKVAYAFRSPSGIHDVENKHQQKSHRNNHNKNSNRGGDASRHSRKPSGDTMEYPFSMAHFRDPSQPSALAQLTHSSYEDSPLLLHSQKTVASYESGVGTYGAGHAAKTPGYHPLKTVVGKAALSQKRNIQLTATSEDIENEKLEENALLPYGDTSPSSRHGNYVFKSRTTAAQVAAYFLMDYEASRPPTLPAAFETITRNQLILYQIHYSLAWRWFVNVAVLVLFLSHTQNLLITAIMHTCVIVVFAVEIQMREAMYGTDRGEDTRHADRKLVRPMTAFLFFLGLESWIWYFVSDDMPLDRASLPLYSSIFKPLVFFYVSAKARDSVEALWRISRIVMRVLGLEFGLILSFAAVGCRMFGSNHESFHNLSTSWLSLFELSTTVVNPSLWMPMYAESRSQSIFFVVFIITCTFYYHSLVLSVVFQTYIQAVTEIHERSASDREDAVRLAFLALMKDGQSDYISVSSVRKCLQVVRPHYHVLKLKALLEIVDPSGEHIVDYPTFRTKIRQALNASIRTARAATSFAMGVEFIAVAVAVLNFIYVILVSSEWDESWFDGVQVIVGSVITLLGLLELVIRFNPLRFQHFAPITRLNPFFDGLALVAALVSFIGIIQYAAGYETSMNAGRAVDFLLLGRAVDMIRVMRFSPLFRDVVRRSADVLPAMAGPLVLVLSVIHIFVFLGIAVWSGAVDVELLLENEELTHLYCLNNFNSYTEGLITIFNVAVVNDWHAIAQVFLYADRNASPVIVYVYFISAICITVFIMLNVITAFFVESFVTKRHDPTEDNLGDDKEVHHRGFQIRTGENTNVRRFTKASSNRNSLRDGPQQADEDDPSSTSPDLDASVSSAASSTEIFSFDVYEREGFDQIMRTVAGSSDAEQEAFARSVCNYLEIFESLCSGREKVGYMICCQQSMNRFGNRRFQTSARGFLTNDTLHKVVSDMHSEVLVLTTRKNTFGDRCLVRSFPHETNNSLKLEISATLLRYQPAATLLVSRIRPYAKVSEQNVKR